MNWLDWLLVAFLVMSIANGFQEGFVRMGIGFAALIAGFFGASWFTGIVAASILPYVHSKPVSYLLGYMLIFFGVMIFGSIVGAFLARVLKIVGLSWMDRLLGGAFGIVRGFIVVVVVAMVMTAFAPKALPRAIDNSRFAPYVLGASRVLTAATPFEIRDGFDRAYKEVQGLWEEALKRKPKHVEVRHE